VRSTAPSSTGLDQGAVLLDGAVKVRVSVEAGKVKAQTAAN
jgi:hypothetical protein